MTTTRRRPALLRLLALLAVLAMVAVACGGGGDDEGGGGGGGNAEEEASGTPKPGGRITMAATADLDGWDPSQNRWAIEEVQVAHGIYDPLVSYDKDLNPKPMLAESFSSNAEFTEWTFKLRPNIKFHNGEPLNAAAVKLNYDKTRASLLTGLALKPIKETQVVDDLTIKFVMSQPWANFPRFLIDQVGVIAAPAQYNDKSKTAEVPIGTGPFMFKEWVKGDHFTMVKNPNYWQKGLPYLDEIVFRTIPEQTSRFSSLESGQLDIVLEDDEDNIVKARKSDRLDIIESKVDEGTFVLINTQQPGPLSDVRIRRAMAHATNREQYNKLISQGIREIADGPWSKSSKWHTESGFPEFDLDKAKELVAEYQKDHPGPVRFQLGLTATPGSVKEASLLQAQWKEAGIDAELKQTEQNPYVNDAVFGKYGANTWRQFGATDPDVDYIWWHSQNAKPIGEIAINFARFSDPETDKALDDARVTNDEAKRKELYAVVAKRMADQVPYIWLTHVVWAAVHQPRVHDISRWKLPDGDQGKTSVQRFELAQIWVDK